MMTEKMIAMQREFEDFVNYAREELMLPHHFHPEDVNWKATRVAIAAQKISNHYGWEQKKPQTWQVLEDTTYWEEEKERREKRERTKWQKFKDNLNEGLKKLNGHST